MRSAVSVSTDIWRLSWLARAQLTTAERLTLDVGLAIVLTAVAAGSQLAGWPLWTAAVAFAGYVGWSLLYSEATIQAARWRVRVAPISPPLVAPLAAEPAASPRKVEASADTGTEQRGDHHEEGAQAARASGPTGLAGGDRRRVLVPGRL